MSSAIVTRSIITGSAPPRSMRCPESRAYFPSPVCGCRDRRTSLHLYPTTNLTTWIWGALCEIPHVVVRSLSGQWATVLSRKCASAHTSVVAEHQARYLTDADDVISLAKRYDTMFGLCRSAARWLSRESCAPGRGGGLLSSPGTVVNSTSCMRQSPGPASYQKSGIHLTKS
jgi:hypothetical protein